MRVGLQPFTISAIEEPFDRKLERIVRARYEGIELGLSSVADAHEAVSDAGLAITSLASSLEEIEADPAAHREACATAGTDDVVIMWLDEEHFASAAAVAETATALDEAADRLAEHDLRLHYHNHDHEFVDVDGVPALERLVEETDRLRFELDLGWAGAGGVDPVALLERIGDRVSLVHVKDMDFTERAFLTFGEGDLDVAGAVDAARSADVDWMIVENDDPVDPIAEPAHASLLLDEHVGHIA